VDARDLPRRLLHVQITVPCQPGKLKLWYPKWIPGTHAPSGPVQNVGGLRLETVEGKPLSWRRDEVDLYRVECDVPSDVREVRVRLDYICNGVGSFAVGHGSAGNRSLGVINWNTCLLYPEGPSSADIHVRLRLQLPPRWHFATALQTVEDKDGRVTFKTETLRDVIDSPLIAGEQVRTIKLQTDPYPPAFLHLASESPGALQLPDKVVGMYSKVVTEACSMMGGANYPAYHFLVTCSDDLGYFGLEHHACSLNGVRERDLIEDAKRKGWVANLLPHEYAHAWCGKYRRPAGMCTPDFHTPQKTKLLWVYEGLTEYLGEILLARSGLLGEKEYKEMLAWTIGTMRSREGRKWRSLEDTAVASSLLRGPSPYWDDLRRGQDYYHEGMLLWLEADAIIRAASEGKRSLDDFCKEFFGPRPSRPGAAKDKTKVVPYELADVVKALKGVADHDWERFFARRVSAPLENLPLDVVGRCGYRLQYATKPPAYVEYIQGGAYGSVSARDSLGVTFSSTGRISAVIPGTVGDRAGLAAGMEVLGVNGKKFSRYRLHDALLDSVTRRKVELLLLEGERFRTVVLDYADGPRYLELARDPKKPDILGDILKPRGK
jgi:predicted metalloprotease with PDZ domain